MKSFCWNTGRIYDEKGQWLSVIAIDDRTFMYDCSRGLGYTFELSEEDANCDRVMSMYDNPGVYRAPYNSRNDRILRALRKRGFRQWRQHRMRHLLKISYCS